MIHPQRQIIQIFILNWFQIVCSIWSIDLSIALLIVWLHEPLSKILKVTSTQGLPCENRSTFRFYVPAGQQSDPIFDWRIQIQIDQKEWTPNPFPGWIQGIQNAYLDLPKGTENQF